MASSKAKTVKAYLAELSPDIRETISRVRDMILKNLPKGYEETMNWGMICYEIPLARYPKTYNGQPLGSVALAAQKNYRSLYLICAYASKASENRLRQAFKTKGLKLDMGKCCIRFKTADDLPLEAIGEMIADVSVKKLIEIYDKARAGR